MKGVGYYTESLVGRFGDMSHTPFCLCVENIFTKPTQLCRLLKTPFLANVFGSWCALANEQLLTHGSVTVIASTLVSSRA